MAPRTNQSDAAEERDEERSESEEKEEPGDVGDGGEENAGGQGGVCLGRAEGEGNQDAGGGGRERVEEHGERDDESQQGAAFPQPTDHAHGETDGQAVDHTHGQFLGENVAAGFAGDFAQGHAADGDGEGLHAGVAALARDDGQEDDERGPASQGRFEDGDHACRQESGKQIDVEPWQAHAEGAPPGRERAFFAGDADHALHIFGGLCADDGDDLAGFDDADEPSIPFEHGQGHVVVLAEQAGDFFLVGVGVDKANVRNHGFREGARGWEEHEVADRDHAQQFFVVVHDVDVGGAAEFGFVFAPDGVEALFDGEGGGQGDEFVFHDGAGGIRGVAQQLRNLGGFGRGELGEHFGALLGVEFRGDVGGFVVRQFLDQMRQFGAGQLCGDGLGEIFVQFGEDLGRGFGRERAQGGDGRLGAESLQLVGDIGRMAGRSRHGGSIAR